MPINPRPAGDGKNINALEAASVGGKVDAAAGAVHSRRMSSRAQIALVIAGYGAAIVAGIVAGRIYDAQVAALPYDTSGGMYAGGEALTSLGVFAIAALFPTLLTLWFLRRNERLWNAIAVAAMAFAAAGLVAVLAPLLTPSEPRHVALALLSLFALAQLLGAPLWSLAFAFFALLAPTRPVRRKLLFAFGIELVIGACAAVHWFVPAPPF